MNLYFEDENGDGIAQAKEIKVANAGHRADTGKSITDKELSKFRLDYLDYIEYYQDKNCN